MANKSERAKQLFLQAKRGWEPNQLDIFKSEKVPLELLFEDMLSLSGVDADYRHKAEFRMMLSQRLKKLLDEKSDFDENYLGKDIKNYIGKREPKSYSIDFGVPIKKNSRTPLPFGDSFTIDGVTFKQITFKQFERPHKNKDCLARYNDKFETNLNKRQDRISLASSLHYFRAKVSSGNYSDALSSVDNAFRAVYTSATVAQSGNTLTHSMFGGGIKSRSVLFPMGIMLISEQGHKDCEIAWDADIRATAEQSIEFTLKPDKVRRYRVFRKTWTEDTPINKRIRKMLVEYASAFHATEPHLRQLGLWRCLEIATSKGNTARPEAEIIQIIATYYRKDEAWKQRGKIIKKVRNAYVHGGTYLEQDEYGSVDRFLNWTQEYVDAVLGMLLVMRKKGIGKKTESEIDAFFDQYPQSNEALNVARIILHHRTK